jgi:hypothetical protein
MWRRGWIGRMLVMAAITVGAALLPAHEAHAMRVRHATLAASMRWESAAIPASFQTIVQQQSPVLLLFLFSLSDVIFPALNRPASPPSR